ncbi:MAG TPA: SDR family NAD(P)-dependent oxidoreductase [Archangium sp.]|nr:SDR family NAD(P)-dependent oxidoreductase [Archangium sp.]
MGRTTGACSRPASGHCAGWALNTRAPYLLSQEVARGMLARGGGDIINILDVGGALAPWRGYSAYGMTKAALAHLTRCVALELAPVIRVNGVAPGTVLPPRGDEAVVAGDAPAPNPPSGILRWPWPWQDVLP